MSAAFLDTASEDQATCARLLLSTIRDGDGLAELRVRRSDGRVRQEWYANPHEAVAHALEVAGQVDVYVGALPRVRRGGGRDALRPHARLCWADCDSAVSVAALDRLPPPTFVVESGSMDGPTPKLHAWWSLREPVTLEVIEHLNRRLVAALGSDDRACDAARILRLLSVGPAITAGVSPGPSFADASVTGRGGWR